MAHGAQGNSSAILTRVSHRCRETTRGLIGMTFVPFPQGKTKALQRGFWSLYPAWRSRMSPPVSSLCHCGSSLCSALIHPRMPLPCSQKSHHCPVVILTSSSHTVSSSQCWAQWRLVLAKCWHFLLWGCSKHALHHVYDSTGDQYQFYGQIGLSP